MLNAVAPVRKSGQAMARALHTALHYPHNSLQVQSGPLRQHAVWERLTDADADAKVPQDLMEKLERIRAFVADAPVQVGRRRVPLWCW